MGEITSAYQEEREAIDETKKERIELAMRLQTLLDDYGYDMRAATGMDGVPYVEFNKRVS